MNADALERDTILVVDDAPDSLRFLTDTLEQAGLTVLIATSGDAALELLGDVLPDMILMDAIMPGRNGFETTRVLKAAPTWSHIPVIFMTGLTDSDHVVEGLAAGGVDYVRKPIVVDELLARVRVHLANARRSRDSQMALDATGRPLMAVTALGVPLWSTPQAERVMHEVALSQLPDGRRGDAAVLGLIQRLVAGGPSAGTAARIELPGGTVEVVVVARPRSDEYLLRLHHAQAGVDIARLQDRHGLTQREAEVLLWISYGKPNRVISDILGISPRTVNKHLEQVFEKLGVETRAAAAAVAVRTMSG
jgi:DNA-binding NarL/FixJ family response regulator